MLYLNEKDIDLIGIDWKSTIKVMEDAVWCLKEDDFAQPIKPYLRYRDLSNRIIAMPAYIGGRFDIAGLKWIASFPGNIHRGINRAHSVTILNSAMTGEPIAIINTAKLSSIRTASVSGLMIQHFLKHRPLRGINIGIVGWGPIGKMHFNMCAKMLDKHIANIFLYDMAKIDLFTVPQALRDKVIIMDSYIGAYTNADIFITCTVSKHPYIDIMPKQGSLQLNVSLRDYTTNVLEGLRGSIIVDDWTEVCRENTDIENMYLQKGLQEKETKTIIDVVASDCLADYASEVPIVFNPMGMAVFDIAIGCYYLDKARELNVGLVVE